MQRANLKAEVAILSTYCNTTKKVRQGEIWMRIRPEMFGTDASRELFDRMSEITDETTAIPTFRVLRRDSKLSPEAKVLLKSASDDILSRDETEATLLQLRDSYKMRILADVNEVLAKAISNSKAPKTEQLERLLEDALFSIRNPDGSSNDLLHGSVGESKAGDLVDSILRGDNARNRIRTGWGLFDTKSGGFNRGDLVVISANFGGGKSVAALTLFRNMHNLKYSVGLATMEMENKEVLERMLSSISGVEYNKIRLNKLSGKEKNKVVAAFDAFEAVGKRWTYYSPTNEVTIKDVFQAMAPYKYDVIFVDYIGLLKQSSAVKNFTTAQALGEAARYCKIMAKKLNCVVVLLAQVNDNGQVFDSRAITHHANTWFKWTCSEEDKARGCVTVEQGKARGAETYDFGLTTDFAYMQMNAFDGPLPEKSKMKTSGFKGRGGDEETKKKPVRMTLMDDD